MENEPISHYGLWNSMGNTDIPLLGIYFFSLWQAYSNNGLTIALYVLHLASQSHPNILRRKTFNILVAFEATFWQWADHLSLPLIWIPKYFTRLVQLTGWPSIK